MSSEVNKVKAPVPEPTGIVSVNTRGAKSSSVWPKLIFFSLVMAILAIGVLVTVNMWRARSQAQKTAAEKEDKAEAKSAMVGQKRKFDTDPPANPSDPAAGHAAGATASADGAQSCADGSQGVVMLGQDGKPMVGPNGAPMRVCKDGKVVVPALAAKGGQGAGAPPGTVSSNGQYQQQGQQVPPSRYGGDVMVTKVSVQGQAAGAAGTPYQQTSDLANSYLQNLIAQQTQKPQGSVTLQPPAGSSAGGQPGSPNPPGSIGSMLQPSQTPAVQATMIGDRNMILAKGSTIDCALSTRVINEVAGMATCEFQQDVYSDNGRVVLAEKGTVATGEYQSAMAQGQKRLFVLWTRIKTPKGVIVNINSPGADALGTAGLPGYVDNHWWERIGGAFMLSLVQDGIGYATAREQNQGGGQSISVFTQSTNTTNRMAEKVLDSTINIKPTLYKNQGDRATIFVARDIDFGSVYALRAR